MSTHKPKTIVFAAMVVLFAVVISFFLLSKEQVLKGITPGITGAVATTSTIQLGPQEVKLISATSTSDCAYRTISSGASILMLRFTGAFGTSTVNGIQGHSQAASTTVTYDSGVFGCGNIYGYAYSSSTVTFLETR